MNPVDIIMITCNRLEITKITVDELYKRIKTPFRLIVVDDMSIDGTAEYLREQKELGRVHVFEQLNNSNICQAYNKGFEFVESEYFITMQDDITPPDLEPDVIPQLIALMEKYPGHAGIGCRIQRIPNLLVNEGNEDLIPARKSLSAYFRIQRKKDFEGRELPFGNRNWDDAHFVADNRGERGMQCSWARNIWADHSRGYCLDRGYLVKPRKWGTGIHTRTRQAHIDKPYPVIDPKTCIPLNILNADKKVKRPLNAEQDFFGYKMLTRRRYYDEKILAMELDPLKNPYLIPEHPELVIDVGAHIGGTSLRCAKQGAMVLAFEPELYNFETLQYNVRRNRFHEHIRCINMGVGKPGRTKLYLQNEPNSGNSGMISSYLVQKGLNEENYEIALFISIKDVFNLYGVEHCDLLKLDCEGGEEDIIRDMDDELASKIDQISVEFHNHDVRRELMNILSKWYTFQKTGRSEFAFIKK